MPFEDDFTTLLKNYPDAIQDKKRLLGLLRDIFTGQPMEINLLSTAYDLGVVKEIDATNRITNAFAYRFVKRLVSEYGVSRLNADWAVSVWCVCYGQHIRKVPCDIQVSKAKAGAAPAIQDRPQNDGDKHYAELFKYVTIDDGLGINGFSGDNVRTLIFPNQHAGKPVKCIMENSFAECAVQEAILTDGITRIAESAFRNCHELKQVVFPTTLIELGDSSFIGCQELVTATLPPTTEQIGKYTFSGTGLKSAVIPKATYWLGEGLFADCKRITKVGIPDSILAIPDRMFCGCEQLSNIELPESIDSIGVSAFEGCASLESILIPESVRTIGENAFLSCAKSFTLLCQRLSVGEQYARSHNINFQLV